MAKKYLSLLSLLLFHFAVQAQWTALNGPPGGNATDIEIDAANSKLYSLINNEHLFVSSNEASTWTEINSVANLYPSDILISGGLLYMVSYYTLYKSEDGGATWLRVSANNQFTGGLKLFRHGTSNTFFLTSWDGLFVSEDAGVNWKKIYETYITDLVITASGDLYFSNNEGISKHTMPSTGQQWAKENISLVYALSNNTIRLTVDGTGIYAITDSDVLKSSNNGTSWPSIKTATITESYFYPAMWGKAPNGLYLFNPNYNTLYFTANNGSTWSVKTAPATSSEITAVRFADNNKAFLAVSNDGILKTTDAASTWTLASSGINLPQGRSIVIAGSGRILISTGYNAKGYWFSDNAGTSWSRKPLVNAIEKLKRLPNNTLLGLGYSQLQYSTDNGTNWTAKSDGTTFLDVTFNTTFSSNTVYGVGYSKIAKSTDGITWNDLSITGLPASGYQGSMVAQDDSGNLYVYLYDYNTGQYQIYVVKGITAAGSTGTATLLSIPLGQNDAQYGLSLYNMFVSNNKFYVASYDQIYITANQGSTWNTVNFSKNSLFPIRKGSDYAICAGTTGSLYTSQDDGKTWISTNQPTSGYTYITDMAEDAAGDYYATGYQTPALKYTNDLILPAGSLPPYIDFNWQATNGPYGGSVTKFFVDNSNNTYALGSGRVYKTTPTFASWADKGYTQWFYDLEFIKSSSTLLGLTYDQIYSSTNGGDTWSALNTESIQQRRVLRRCPNGDLVLMAAGNSVYVSTNGGGTFGTAKFTTSTHLIRDVIVTSNNSIIVYLRPNTSPFTHSAVISTDRGVTWNPMNLNASTTSFSRLSADANGNIYSSVNPASKSSDNGANWTSIVGDLPSNIFSKVFVSPSNALYVLVPGTTYSLYKSANGGTNWTKAGDFPVQLSVNDISWIGSLMIVATSQGVYTSADDGATFSYKSTGLTFSQLDDLELGGPSKLLATAGGLGFYTTDGSEWISNNVHNITRFFRKPDGTLLGYSFSNLYSTPDQGLTWNSISEFPPNGLEKVVTGDNTTFYGYDFEKIYVSTDLNAWNEFAVTGLPANSQVSDLTADANGFIYVLLYNPATSKSECYQIVFGAASKLTRFENPSSLMFRDGKVFLYESTGKIASCSDGSNWTTQAAPSGDRLIITTNNYYFVPQYGGSLWLSRDRGASWQNVGLSTSSDSYRFTDIVVNEYNGYAYGAISNSVVRKSANIIIPPETTNPLLGSLLPANNATNVVATSPLKITFDEACLSVSGKKVRIFDSDNTVTAVEIIDAATGIQDGKSFIFTPASPLAYENTYFIIVDNGAFTDIFGNPFAGITSQTAWKFTIQVEPDNIKPVISPNSAALVKGATNKLQITVTDAGGSGLNAASVKIFYRGIMSTDPPTEAVMTNPSGNTFEVTVADGWIDELGLEYAYEARDNQGNIQLSPDGGVAEGNYHRANVSFSETASPTLPASVLSFGGKLENYRVFSIPHKLSNANINAVFSEVATLQPKKDFRILHFATESGKYNEFPTLSSITRGMGYWINFKDVIDSKVEGASTPDDSKNDLFSYTLKPGWNQIGNPYPFTISWNAVKTAAGNANIGVLKVFNGSSFADDDKMNPFEGGFVLLNGTADVTVEFPFSAKTTSGRTGEHQQDFSGGWIIPLTVENSKFHTLGGVGMHPQANISFDRYDDAMPPAVFDLPEISFDHPEHLAKHFSRDVVPQRNEFVWTFTITSGGETAVLKWDPNSVESLGNDLYLLDEKQQQLINMAELDHCEITPDKSAAFKLFYGYRIEDIKPTKIQLGKPYPNPFTTDSHIAFTLPENNSGAYTVALDVYDTMGKKVATIARGQYPSGFYLKEWTPEPGSANASLYLFRLTVSGTNADIMLTEKIMTFK